jgi:hypothetical protein
MAGKALDGTSLTPEARVANNIVRISNEDGTAGTGFKMPMTDISLRDIQRTLNQAQALLASSGAAITAGQGYIIDNGGVAQLPTGISLMRVVGINLPSGVKGFSPNAEAYLTTLSRYVPCTYDVATNTAQFDYLIWAGHISQTSTDAPTIDSENYNISGETPIFGYNSAGLYQIIFTGGKLISDNSVAHFSFTYDGENQGFVVVKGGDLNTVDLFCYKGGVLTDDRLNNVYIQIRLVYTLN